MNLRLVTPPAGEPITLLEAKAHLRATDLTDEDALIQSLICAARQVAEHLTGRALMPQAWELALDAFPSQPIALPRSPLRAVQSVQYLDSAGALQLVDPAKYLVDDFSEPGLLLPAAGACWPATAARPNAARIRFEAGYDDAAAVPQAIKQWMLLRIGMLYENREAVAAGVTFAELPHVDGLLDPYRVWGVV